MRRDEEPEQLLSCINAFAVSFCKACRDNERAEHLRKKQEKAEAERAARRPSGGAPGATAKGKVPVKAVRSTKDHYMNRIQVLTLTPTPTLTLTLTLTTASNASRARCAAASSTR